MDKKTEQEIHAANANIITAINTLRSLDLQSGPNGSIGTTPGGIRDLLSAVMHHSAKITDLVSRETSLTPEEEIEIAKDNTTRWHLNAIQEVLAGREAMCLISCAINGEPAVVLATVRYIDPVNGYGPDTVVTPVLRFLSTGDRLVNDMGFICDWEAGPIDMDSLEPSPNVLGEVDESEIEEKINDFLDKIQKDFRDGNNPS